MSLYDKITALNDSFSTATIIQPGSTTIEKLKAFHDALVEALSTLSLLQKEEFLHPSIQTFVESTIALKCDIRVQLDKLNIDRFMANR